MNLGCGHFQSMQKSPKAQNGHNLGTQILPCAQSIKSSQHIAN